MGRWTYYSPLWLGPLLVLALNDSIRAQWPGAEMWAQWSLVALTAVSSALACQLLMIGAQGAFAQVVPVPWGRSIRGGPAMLVGWLLIASITLGATSAMFSLEGTTTLTIALGVISLAALLTAGAAYAWNIPAAVTDFTRERGLP